MWGEIVVVGVGPGWAGGVGEIELLCVRVVEQRVMNGFVEIYIPRGKTCKRRRVVLARWWNQSV